MSVRRQTRFEETTGQNSAHLSARFGEETGLSLLHPLITDVFANRIALVSSFGADSVVLLHMVSQIDPTLPILFLETGHMFTQTLDYQKELSERLGLKDVRLIRPTPIELELQDSKKDLWRSHPDACCELRKVRPLNKALSGFDAWITGRKRFQAFNRAALSVFEEEASKIKINPLVDWSAEMISRYIHDHDLPPHPLVAEGYASIGCAPCTTPVMDGEDTRAGRWRDTDKIECGIHFQDGKAVPTPRRQTLSPQQTS